jgi:hypothetical protein
VTTAAKAQPPVTVTIGDAVEYRVADITVREGRRPVKPEGVASLVASIKEHGLLQPVAVDADGVLIWGAHRLQAHIDLGRETIKSYVLTVDGIDHGLMEIDENLVRQDLTVSERSIAFARRKELYEAKYPETVRGAAGGHGKARKSRDATSSAPVPSFADATAAATGFSPKTIMEDVRIAEKVHADPTVAALLEEAGLSDNRDAQRTLSVGEKTTEEMVAMIEGHMAGDKISSHKVSDKPAKNGKAPKPQVVDVVEPQGDPIAPHAYVAQAIAAIMSLPQDYSITHTSMQEFRSAHPNYSDLVEASKRFAALAEFVNALGGVN